MALFTPRGVGYIFVFFIHYIYIIYIYIIFVRFLVDEFLKKREMAVHASPYPSALLCFMDGVSWAFIFPCYWLLDRLLGSCVPTTLEKRRRSQDPCSFSSLSVVVLVPLYLVLLLASLPFALLGFLVWAPVQTARLSYLYTHQPISDKQRAAEQGAGLVPGEWRAQGRSFCFSSANVCLLPDAFARFNNLADTQSRAVEVGRRIRNGASRPQIKIYIDSPTNTSISAASFSSLATQNNASGGGGFRRTSSLDHRPEPEHSEHAADCPAHQVSNCPAHSSPVASPSSSPGSRDCPAHPSAATPPSSGSPNGHTHHHDCPAHPSGTPGSTSNSPQKVPECLLHSSNQDPHDCPLHSSSQHTADCPAHSTVHNGPDCPLHTSDQNAPECPMHSSNQSSPECPMHSLNHNAMHDSCPMHSTNQNAPADCPMHSANESVSDCPMHSTNQTAPADCPMHSCANQSSSPECPAHPSGVQISISGPEPNGRNQRHHHCHDADASSLESRTASRESLTRFHADSSGGGGNMATNNTLSHRMSVQKRHAGRKRRHGDDGFDHEISAFFPANLDFLALQVIASGVYDYKYLKRYKPPPGFPHCLRSSITG